METMVREVESRLKEHQVTVSLTDSAKEWLAAEGFDPVFGARPLRRTIQRCLESPLSKLILSGEVEPGGYVVVEAGDGGLSFITSRAAVEAGRLRRRGPPCTAVSGMPLMMAKSPPVRPHGGGDTFLIFPL